MYGGFGARKSSESPAPPPPPRHQSSKYESYHKLTSEKQQLARPMTSLHVSSKRSLNERNNKGFVRKLFKDIEDKGAAMKRL